MKHFWVSPPQLRQFKILHFFLKEPEGNKKHGTTACVDINAIPRKPFCSLGPGVHVGQEKAPMETLATEHFQLRDHRLWTHNDTEPRPHQLMQSQIFFLSS